MKCINHITILTKICFFTLWNFKAVFTQTTLPERCSCAIQKNRKFPIKVVLVKSYECQDDKNNKWEKQWYTLNWFIAIECCWKLVFPLQQVDLDKDIMKSYLLEVYMRF